MSSKYKIDGDDPAMPCTIYEGIQSYSGLTVRQYFAAMAMQGLCANSHSMKEAMKELLNRDEDSSVFYQLNKSAVECADELIKALNK